MVAVQLAETMAHIQTDQLHAKRPTFKLSGSSLRPAYPGFIVMNTEKVGLQKLAQGTYSGRLGCISMLEVCVQMLWV